MPTIIAILLTNDKSDEIPAFVQTIKALIKNGYRINFITTPQHAHLFKNMFNVNTHLLAAPNSNNPLLKLLGEIRLHIALFLMVNILANPNTIVYINGTQPFSAALAGRIKRARIIYLIQNCNLKPNIIERFALSVANRTARQLIIGSVEAQRKLALTVKQQTVVYPALTTEFTAAAYQIITAQQTHINFTVTMVSAIDDSNGISAFLKLAHNMPHFNFELAVTDNDQHISYAVWMASKPFNLSITPKYTSLHTVYQRASVIVNLRDNAHQVNRCDTCILQALHYGKPVIISQNSLSKEFIHNRKHGIVINRENIDAICDALDTLYQTPVLYNQMSAACRQHALLFSQDSFDGQIINLFKGNAQPVYGTLNRFFGDSFLKNDASGVKKRQVA